MSLLSDPEANALMDSVSRALSASDARSLNDACRRLVMAGWRHMEPRQRFNFVGQLDLTTGALKPSPKVSPSMRRDQRTNDMLRAVPDMLGGAMDEASRGFLSDIAKKSKRHGFKMTEKQEGWLSRLYHEHLTAPEDDGGVIE